MMDPSKMRWIEFEDSGIFIMLDKITHVHRHPDRVVIHLVSNEWITIYPRDGDTTQDVYREVREMIEGLVGTTP